MDPCSDGLLAELHDSHDKAPINPRRPKPTTRKVARMRIKRLKGSNTRLQSTRQRWLQKRAELQMCLESVSNFLDAVQQAQLDFMDKAQGSSVDRLHSEHAKFEHVAMELHNNVAHTRLLMADLDQLESKLDEDDAVFVQDAEDMISPSAPGPKKGEGRMPAEMCMQTSSPSSRDATPSPRTKYFSRAGDVKVWTERLQDLEDNYLDAMTQRDMVADRGDPLDSSDEQMQHTYELARRHLQSKLDEATCDRDALRLICKELNLDLDPRQGGRSESSTTGADFKDTGLCSEPFVEVTTDGILRDHSGDGADEKVPHHDHSTEAEGDGKVWSWIHHVGNDDDDDDDDDDAVTPETADADGNVLGANIE